LTLARFTLVFVENSRSEFHHSFASRAGLALLTMAGGWATVAFWRFGLDGVGMLIPVFPFMVFLFAAYRWYLTFRSVVIADGSLALVHAWGRREVQVAAIKAIRFDSYPNDLIVDTDTRSLRLPRTIQGFQKLHEKLITLTHIGESEAFPVEVRVRRSLRYVSLIALVFQTVVGFLVARQGFTLFAAALGVVLLVATAVFLDQYLMRRCIFLADGLWVHGLFGRKFFPHTDLVNTEVKKTNLWTRMKLHFGKTTVTLEDQVLDLPVVRLARIVEHEWGHNVHGANTAKP